MRTPNLIHQRHILDHPPLYPWDSDVTMDFGRVEGASLISVDAALEAQRRRKRRETWWWLKRKLSSTISDKKLKVQDYESRRSIRRELQSRHNVSSQQRPWRTSTARWASSFSENLRCLKTTSWPASSSCSSENLVQFNWTSKFCQLIFHELPRPILIKRQTEEHKLNRKWGDNKAPETEESKLNHELNIIELSNHLIEVALHAAP